MSRLKRLNTIIDILTKYGLVKKAADSDLPSYYTAFVPGIDKSKVSPLIDYINGNFFQRTAAAAKLQLAGIDTSQFPRGFINEARELIHKHPEITTSSTIPPKIVDEFMDLLIRYPELDQLSSKLGSYMMSQLNLPVPTYDEFFTTYGRLAGSVGLPPYYAEIASRLVGGISRNKRVDPGIWYHLLRLYLREAAKQNKFRAAYSQITSARR